MAIQVSKIERRFLFKNETISDPNPNMTPYEVLDHLSSIYPQFATAEVNEGEIVDGVLTYNIKEVATEKG
jgi:PRTRC genetic system protein C